MNGFGEDALCVIEPLMEVYKFYGKSQAARSVVNFCSRNRFLTTRILVSFVATIDPWEEDLRITTVRITRNALTKDMQRKNRAPEALVASDHNYEIYSAKSLGSQFNEIRKFILEQMAVVVSPLSQADVLEAPIAMLWFLRRSIEAVLDRSAQEVQLYFVAFQCLEVAYSDFCELHTNTQIKKSTFHTLSTRSGAQYIHKPLYFSFAHKAGDFTDIFLYLLEIIALRIEKEHVSRVVEFRKQFLNSVQHDSRLLMGWLEEQ